MYQTFETRSTHNNKHNYNNNNDSLVLSATRKRTVTHTPLDIRSLFCNETCPFPLLPTNTPLPKLDAILPPANASEQQSPSSPVASGSPPSPPPTADQKNRPRSVLPAPDGRRGDDARCREQQPIGDGAEKGSGTAQEAGGDFVGCRLRSLHNSNTTASKGTIDDDDNNDDDDDDNEKHQKLSRARLCLPGTVAHSDRGEASCSDNNNNKGSIPSIHKRGGMFFLPPLRLLFHRRSPAVTMDSRRKTKGTATLTKTATKTATKTTTAVVRRRKRPRSPVTRC